MVEIPTETCATTGILVRNCLCSVHSPTEAAPATEQAAHAETRRSRDNFRAEADARLDANKALHAKLATTEAALEAAERERDEWQIRAEVAEEIAAEVAVLDSIADERDAAEAALADAKGERDALREALLEWWDDPDNPPILAAELAAACQALATAPNTKDGEG